LGGERGDSKVEEEEGGGGPWDRALLLLLLVPSPFTLWVRPGSEKEEEN
jgi:hypothetical protein